MFNLQGSEIIVILLLALVILGPEKLPDAIRRFSQTYAELKKMGTGFQSELRSALDEPMREMRETAALVRDAADPEKLAEQAEAEAAVQAAAGDTPIDRRAFTIDDPAAESLRNDVRSAAGERRPAAEVHGDRTERGADDDRGDGDPAGPPAGPINQIAAANASAALFPTVDGPQPDTDDGHVDGDPDGDPDGDTALARPSGPAFHSAAPKPPAAARVDAAGADGAGIDGAGDRAVADATPTHDIETPARDATEEANAS